MTPAIQKTGNYLPALTPLEQSKPMLTQKEEIVQSFKTQTQSAQHAYYYVTLFGTIVTLSAVACAAYVALESFDPVITVVLPTEGLVSGIVMTAFLTATAAVIAAARPLSKQLTTPEDRDLKSLLQDLKTSPKPSTYYLDGEFARKQIHPGLKGKQIRITQPNLQSLVSDKDPSNKDYRSLAKSICSITVPTQNDEGQPSCRLYTTTWLRYAAKNNVVISAQWRPLPRSSTSFC